MPEGGEIRRVEAFEFVERMPTLEAHDDLVRLILVEAKLLSDTYRRVTRHDIPNVREIAGLFDVLKQEIDMREAPVEYPAGDPSES